MTQHAYQEVAGVLLGSQEALQHVHAAVECVDLTVHVLHLKLLLRGFI